MVALPTILIWVGAIGVVLATFLGHHRLDRWKVYLLIFGLLSAIGATWSEINARHSAEQLDAKNVEILRVTRESAADQETLSRQLIGKTEEIRELYRQLAEKNEEIAKTSGEIVSTLLGGPSFPYIGLADRSRNPAMVLVNDGDYPLSDLSVRMVDLQAFEKLVADKATPMSVERLAQTDVVKYKVESLGPKQAVMLGRLRVPDQSTLRYNIFLTARNGNFHQQLQLARSDGAWKLAFRVSKTHSGKESSTELRTFRDPGFPTLQDGSVEWW